MASSGFSLVVSGTQSRINSLTLVFALGLSGCSSGNDTARPEFPESKWGVSASPRLVANGSQPIPKGGGAFKIGNPYQVGGRWYYPRHEPGYHATGVASWYGSDFHGRKTSNGEIYDMTALTAAHKTLPMPCYAYVTNLENGRTILVRVNDRGPYVSDRLIDLSKASADALGYGGSGLVNVRVRYAGAAPLNGDDTREQRFLASQPWSNWQPRIAMAPPPGPPPRPVRPSFAAYEPPPSPRPVPREGWSPFGYRSSVLLRSGLSKTP